jgi:hypothetical protein
MGASDGQPGLAATSPDDRSNLSSAAAAFGDVGLCARLLQVFNQLQAALQQQSGLAPRLQADLQALGEAASSDQLYVSALAGGSGR